MVTFRLLLVVAIAVVASSCTPGPTLKAEGGTPAVETRMAWLPLGSWQGHGAMQTESFYTDTSMLRVKWVMRDETRKDAGTLRLALSSSISGRELATLVDHRGIGDGEEMISEGGRPMFIVVESADADWAFTVDEGYIVHDRTPSDSRRR
jgi:hypothetical protein